MKGRMNMIEIKEINKSYKFAGGEIKVLNGVNLKASDGEVVAVMGSSGSGKTTLLNIIGCMDNEDSGEYRYGDELISGMKKRERELFRKKHIGFIFQQFALLNDYTVYENVELPLRAQNMKKADRKRTVNEALKSMQIENLSKKYPTQISGGEQQRCAIARAIVSGGDIILADEPTGALDSKTGNEIIDVIVALARKGKTVIVVTHDMHVAEKADRIVYIKDGKIEI